MKYTDNLKDYKKAEPRVYLNDNVYDAAIKRIAFIFERFDNVLVSFSGGKDSGVTLNLVYDYAKEHGFLHKLAMYHLDYEAQYQMTTDYVTETFKGFEGIRKYWCCLPVGADCGCRMDSDRWIPWEKEKQSIWVRKMPDSPYVINEDNCPFEMKEGETDYKVQMKFEVWFKESNGGGDTCVITGIRAGESYVRYIRSRTNINKFEEKKYLLSQLNGVVHGFPIYDWETSDIWVYNARFEKPYNHLYDLFYMAGVPLEEMRVANPFHSCGTADLKYYKVIDPNNWGKMIGRVNGVNMAGLYGGTTAMGWRNITKPSHFTWKEYCYFLLNTLDDKLRDHYLQKLSTSIKFWREKGGALEQETIKELEMAGIKFVNRGPISLISDKDVCTFEDYPDDVEIKDFSSVPSYKRMCVCIIKNDYTCKYMGFAQTKEEKFKHKEAMEKYKSLTK